MKEIAKSNILEDKTSLDFSLYKFCFLGALMHGFLYFFPSIELSVIFSILFLIYFSVTLVNISNKNLVILFAEILVVFTIYLYFLTWLVAYYLCNIWLDSSLEYVVSSTLHTNLPSYFLAGVYLFIFHAAILFFSKIIPVDYYVKTKLKLELPDLSEYKDRILILLILTLVIESFYFFTGLLGNLNADFILIDVSEGTTWWTHIFFFITAFHLLLNVLFVRTFTFKHNFFAIVFIFFSFIINLLLFGYVTRRATMVFFIVAILMYIFTSDKKIKTSNLILLSIIAGILAYQSLLFTTSMRERTFGWIEHDATLKDTLTQTGKTFLTRGDLRSETGKKMAEGFSYRVISNSALPTLFYHNSMEENRYSYGSLLAQDLVQLIPQVIFPGKSKFLNKAEIIGSLSSSPLMKKDHSDSYYYYSYMEFGLFGLLIYPIIINLCLLFFYIVINFRFFSKITGVYIVVTLLPLLTIDSIDGELGEILFRMRNIIVFVPFFNLLILNLDPKKR